MAPTHCTMAPSPCSWLPSVGTLNSQVMSQQREPSWEMRNRAGGVSNKQVHCAVLDVLSVDGHDSQPDRPLSALLQDLLSDQPEKADDTDSVSIPEERWVQLFQLMERQHNEKMIEQHEQHNQQIQLLQSQMMSLKLPTQDDRGVRNTDRLVDKPHVSSGCLSLSEAGPPVSSSGVHQCSVRETVLCCFRTQDEAILRTSQPHPGHLSRNCANQVTVSSMAEPHSIFQQIITVDALPCIDSSLNDETECDNSQQSRNLQLCVQEQTDKQEGPLKPQEEPSSIGNDISSVAEDDIGMKRTLSLDDCTVHCSAASTLKPLEMHAATESLNGTSEPAAITLASAVREDVTSLGSSQELLTVTSDEREEKSVAHGSANDNTIMQGLQKQLIRASSDTATEGKADLALNGSEKEAASSAAVLMVHTSAPQTEVEQDDNGPTENAANLDSLLDVVGSYNGLDPAGGRGNTSGETCSLEQGNLLRMRSHVYNGCNGDVVKFPQEILNQCRPLTSWAEKQQQRQSKDLEAETENVASLEGKVMPSGKHLQSDHGNDVEPTEAMPPKEAWQSDIPEGPFVSSYTDKYNSPSRTVSLDSLCRHESDDRTEPAGSIVPEGKSSNLPNTSCSQAHHCPNSGVVGTFTMSSLPSQISRSPTPSLHASVSLSVPEIPAHLLSFQPAMPASSTSLPPQQDGSLLLNCSLRDLFHSCRTRSLEENSCDLEGFWLGAAVHPSSHVRSTENPQQGKISNSLIYTSPSQHGHFVPLVGNMSRLSCPSQSESSVLGSSASAVGVAANHREVTEEELQLSHPVFIHPRQEGSSYVCSLNDSETTATTLESCDPVQLSRLRVFLREKHNRHLSDVRAYYETELAALTEQLARHDASSSHRDTALTVTGLSERCKEAEKALHSATQRIHDLESRNRDLDRELEAWPKRYDTAVQATHMMQRTLEEVRARCEREERAAKALRTRVREVERAYNDLYHSADNQEERSHRERRMLQDLLAEYETLTNEHAHMKETLRSTENRLIDANDEAAELKRLNSRLEVQIKQMEHGRSTTHAHRNSDGISDLLHISISPSHIDGKASTNCSPRHVSSSRRKWLTSPQEVPFANTNRQVEGRMHSPPEKDGGSRSCDSPRSGSPDLGPVLRACQDLRDAEQTSSVANRSPGTHKHRSSNNSQGQSRPEHDGFGGEVNEEARHHPSPIATPLGSWPTRRSSSVPPCDRGQSAALGKQTTSISTSPRKDSHNAQQRDAVLPGYSQFHKKEEGQSTSLEPVSRPSTKKRLNLALNTSASGTTNGCLDSYPFFSSSWHIRNSHKTLKFSHKTLKFVHHGIILLLFLVL
uniref:M-phase phosphoprotein 9 isoform X2 n=1 Tax=Myxine glutinosa TaxID=7769 RepID=UPI0035902109